jgi:ATP-dependent helicase/nuclease subunit A
VTTEDYLDITKSVLISSPAGSGKTERLAKRYISLLRSGFPVERILAITFTDKAAAEMKERILNILKNEAPEMFIAVRENIPRMRISTIHSFCLKLLKRFCLDLGMDPSLAVMDSFTADTLWSEAIYESLLEDGVSGDRLFYGIIRDKGIKGWNKLYDILHELHAKRPGIELGVREIGVTLGVQDSEVSCLSKILTLYERCLDRYRKKKFQRHSLDYNDLELMAYEAISKNPEWQNVLFSFDEHTDHLLVDEFQDTSSLQWKIIDKLTEEWRSGLGSKRDAGTRPTIFLVGDDKQSIYSFRGAEVSIFKNARKHLAQWLGDEYHFLEVKENYRSLPAIIDFVNALFERLMPRGFADDEKITYTPFEAARKSVSGSDGSVELLVIRDNKTVRESRRREASAIAEKIKGLQGRYDVHDQDKARACTYGDMAILLRSRTHLSAFEDALRREDIPFVVVKGIGFYNTPEVTVLKDILFFLIDPKDDYSLFRILRSPLFSLDYRVLFRIMRDAVRDGLPSGYLYQALDAEQHRDQGTVPLQGSLWEQGGMSPDQENLLPVMGSLARWLGKRKGTSYAMILEEILNESEAWQYFHERQRYLNAKKFIKLIEEFESAGCAGLEMREKLIRASARTDEPKANVNTEGMNAVRLMTIHASKGLQFPMVFLPCLDEEPRAQGSSPIAMDECGERIIIGYEDDSETRKTIPLFMRQKEKGAEEEKRLFYVGVTRAMDYLCMSGVSRNDTFSGKLAHLSDAFALRADTHSSESDLVTTTWITAKEDEVRPVISPESRPPLSPSPSFQNEPMFIDPIDRDYKPLLTWLDVTEEMDSIRRKHGEDWVILGRAFHRLFEGLSHASISLDMLEESILPILRNETVSDKNLEGMRAVIMSDMQRLREGELLGEIVLPQEHSYVELPFILQRGDTIYRGRVDRVIIKGDRAFLYDYKTYPVSEDEVPYLSRRYSFQMGIYRDAIEQLLSVKTRAFLFFTHELKLVEV